MDDPNDKARIINDVSGEIEEFTDQYNANQDFAVFSVKDQTLGGLMDL